MSLLADLVFQRTYAQTKKDGSKETRNETVNRVKNMHLKKFPDLAEDIEEHFSHVHNGLDVPSMRAMQFAGQAIERENVRIFNCAFAHLSDFKTFAELMYLLLCGTGTGYSVQFQHVAKLPVISEGVEKEFMIFDCRESWCDSVFELLKNPKIKFDYSLIRPAGSPVSSGGTASGPEPLRLAHEKIRNILQSAAGRQLKSIEAHDIMCHIADSVIVGGVRRSAMISLFSKDDNDMLTAKAGNWWETNPQRGRSNNSAVLVRSSPTLKAGIRTILEFCFASNAGEPGLFVTNNPELGGNPCFEISLKSHQFCNLTEVLVHNCKTTNDFFNAVASAAFIGTLQASYTTFGYLSERWKTTTEEEALLGVSLTGQAMNWDMLSEENLLTGAVIAKNINKVTAKQIGINPAARITTVKPSGSTSAANDCTSGIHAAHSEFYIRRIRIEKTSPLAKYLISMFGLGSETVEMDKFNPDQIVVSVPYNMKNAIHRTTETAIQLLERMKHINQHWVKPGHISGENTHNVSLTVNYLEHEKEGVIQWIQDNTDYFTGISLLPSDNGTYVQAPFESIDEARYLALLSVVESVKLNLKDVDWMGTVDKRQEEAACAGGACEIS